MKKRIFDIIQIGNKQDFPSRFFDIFISANIILNILSMFLETFDELAFLMPVLKTIEVVTVGVFCVEYILRIWTADLLYPHKKPFKARLKFLVSFDGVIDLMTILPFFFLSGFIVLRMLRVVRIFHLFRINNQYDSFHVITGVIKENANKLISSMFIILILMVASSLGMYNAEHDAQPEAFSNAFSGIWWSVSTLLTVGYGDIYPVTAVGRLMAILIAFLGVGAVAIPTGIISAGFVEQYRRNENSDTKLPDINRIGEIIVEPSGVYTGRTVGEIKREYGMKIYLVIRDDLSIVALDSMKVTNGDILIIESEKLVKSGRKSRKKSK